jgi:hypothetical protein
MTDTFDNKSIVYIDLILKDKKANEAYRNLQRATGVIVRLVLTLQLVVLSAQFHSLLTGTSFNRDH